jgi:hypothetical protein
LFWKYDPVHFDGEVVSCVPLFSPNGAMSSKWNSFVVSVTELEKVAGVRYIVTGQDRNESFVYFSLISVDLSSTHYSFATNDAHFRWNPSKCLLASPVAIVANCLSSIKIIATFADNQVHLFQFDIYGFLSKQLGDNGHTIDSFEVDIIEKCPDQQSVIVAITYLYYSEEREKWYHVLTLLELPVDGKPFRRLHRESQA